MVLIFLNSILQAQVSTKILMVVWAEKQKSAINLYQFKELNQGFRHLTIRKYPSFAGKICYNG